jgi:membrane protease YdiL (CAAX protease family)
MGLLIFLPMILTLPYLIYFYRDSGLTLTPELLLADKQFIFLNIVAVFPVHFLTLAMVWGVVTQFGKFRFATAIGWSWGDNFGLAKSALLAFGMIAITFVLGALLGGKITDMEKLISSSRMTAYATALLATATAPFVEEFVYRGVLYSAFQRVAGSVWATVIVGSIFAGIHFPQYWPNLGALSAIVLLSVVLTVVRAKTGRILPCVIIHLIFNGVQSLLIVFEPFLERWLQPRGEKAAFIQLVAFLFQRLG